MSQKRDGDGALSESKVDVRSAASEGRMGSEIGLKISNRSIYAKVQAELHSLELLIFGLDAFS